MDAKDFAPGAPGRLVRTINKFRRPDIGFIPDPLPRRLALSPQTRALLARAREAAARLAEAGARFPAPALAAEFLQLREAILSSASLRPAEVTARLLSFGGETGGRHGSPLGAWRAAYRYRRVLRAALDSVGRAGRVPLLPLVQEIHAGLFEGRPRRSVFPGRLRRGPIQMGDRAHYVPPPYAWVVPCLAVLERDLARPPEIDPLLVAYLTHYQFVTIHPFADGNGRIGRILLAAMVNRALGLAPPLLCVSPFLVRQKQQYVGRLYRVNTHGEWPVWLDFCLRATIVEAEDALRRLAGLARLREKCGAEPLADDLLAAPGFSAPQFEKICERHAREPTAELERLERAAIVRAAAPRWKPRQYLVPGALGLLLGEFSAARRGGELPRPIKTVP